MISLHGDEGMFNAARELFDENMKYNYIDVSKIQHKITILEALKKIPIQNLKRDI